MKYLSHNIFLFCHSIKVFEFYNEFAKKDEEHHSLIIYAYETPSRLHDKLKSTGQSSIYENF